MILNNNKTLLCKSFSEVWAQKEINFIQKLHFWNYTLTPWFGPAHLDISTSGTPSPAVSVYPD